MKMTNDMKKLIGCGLLLLAAVCSSCMGKPGGKTAAANAVADSVAKGSFPFPTIPATLSSPEARKDWLLAHYWDRFDFADTALVHNRDITEQGFANFLALLADGATPEATVSRSLEAWCGAFAACPEACDVMTSMADSYLYDPNSPYYSEPLYGLYLKAMLQALPSGDARRQTMEFRLRLISRNNVGSTATDFAYRLPDGREGRLSTTKARGGRLLLMFYDPGCESCHEVLARMKADDKLAGAVKEGRVTVLAVYTEDDDALWRSTLKDMPQGWIVATDRQAVKNGALYDLKAMPSLYLLDGAGRVVMKDAQYDAVREAL